ncbi:MAG: hypothetical protein K0Q79_1924 [Flavipsychrobacter sp.]|jgi:hypothetical protein|nr:hypothetical protein [Flavipsychrobacter sp.]
MIHIPNTGLYFCIAFAVMLLATWLMSRQGRHLFTKDPLRRKFTMLEMEFPAKSYELETLINGIYLLPDEAPKTIKALKKQLLLDYLLFIPAVYSCIYILCMHIAVELKTEVGRYWFMGLGWAQIIPFILDYIENTYFWIMINKRNIPVPKPDVTKPEPVSRPFKMMQLLQVFKWGIPLIGAVCSISVVAYFWLSGRY